MRPRHTRIETMLEDMLGGYIAAALWSTTDESDEAGGSALDENYSREDIAPGTLAAMRQDCEDFIAVNRAHIEAGPGDASQAGHDFWLTRCGHGVGFWDRGDNVWSKAARDAMDAYSEKAGNVDLYVGDGGLIYG